MLWLFLYSAVYVIKQEVYEGLQIPGFTDSVGSSQRPTVPIYWVSKSLPPWSLYSIDMQWPDSFFTDISDKTPEYH